MKNKRTIKVTYIGGPTALLEIGGLRLMTDPTLDPSGSKYTLGTITLEKSKSPVEVDTDAIDIVLLSHDQHRDNLDDEGRNLVQKVTKTYTTMAGAERLKGTSIGMMPWQTETVSTPEGDEIVITAVPARHGPAGIEKITGDVIGFVLSIKGEENMQLYITGDTVYYEGVAEVAKRYNPKYVFIFAGAAQSRGPFNLTMGTNDAIDTAFAFPDSTIIPLHYEGWKHFSQNADDLKRSFEVLGITHRLHILEAGLPTILEF